MCPKLVPGSSSNPFQNQYKWRSGLQCVYWVSPGPQDHQNGVPGTQKRASRSKMTVFGRTTNSTQESSSHQLACRLPRLPDFPSLPRSNTPFACSSAVKQPPCIQGGRRQGRSLQICRTPSGEQGVLNHGVRFSDSSCSGRPCPCRRPLPKVTQNDIISHT